MAASAPKVPVTTTLANAAWNFLVIAAQRYWILRIDIGEGHCRRTRVKMRVNAALQVRIAGGTGRDIECRVGASAAVPRSLRKSDPGGSFTVPLIFFVHQR